MNDDDMNQTTDANLPPSDELLLACPAFARASVQACTMKPQICCWQWRRRRPLLAVNYSRRIIYLKLITSRLRGLSEAETHRSFVVR